MGTAAGLATCGRTVLHSLLQCLHQEELMNKLEIQR